MTLYAVGFGNGVYVLGGANGTVGRSTDALTWTTARQQLPLIADVTFALDQFVLVGGGGTIVTSPDAITFTGRNSGTTNDLRAIVFGNGTFVTVGSEGVLRISADGANWTSP